MSDKIGVLGESTATAVASDVAAYTVPAGKAAKCQIMLILEGHGSNSTGDYLVKVNNAIVASRLNIPATEKMWSNTTTLIHDPSTSVDPDGSTAVLTQAPAPFVYYLSAADRITFTIGTDALVTHVIQVVGTEIDV